MVPASSRDAHSAPVTPADSDRYTAHRYTRVKYLVPWHEEAGSAPIQIEEFQSSRKDEVDKCTSSIEREAAQARYTLAAQPKLQSMLMKQIQGGKLFLAQEFETDKVIDDETIETLLRLLNHPNLVNLVDTQKDRSSDGREVKYTVWEYCDKGTLNRLLWHAPGQEQIEVPESLCWHVLNGVSQALLWLHYGRKITLPFHCHINHEDWYPVLMTDISPASIYFCSPEDDETYGLVKLGNFGSTFVTSNIMPQEMPPPTFYSGKYQPPEIRDKSRGVDMKWDIWSLGAVLYHMMVGAPPVDSRLPDEPGHHHRMKAFPKRYSSALREIVKDMLHVEKERRPTTADLERRVRAGFKNWRETTEEGRDFIDREDT